MFVRGFVAMVSGMALLVSQPGFAQSASLRYPVRNLGDNGGRLGIMVDTADYTQNGIHVVKVLSVNSDSGLYGVVAPGDLIYGVNGFNLHDGQDIDAVVNVGSPGVNVTVYYLDSRRSYAPMQVTVRTVGFPRTTTAAVTTNPHTPSYCEEHYIVCGVGLVVGAVVVASAVSGSNSSSGSGSSGSSSRNPEYTYYKRQTYSAPEYDSPPPDPAPQGCTYGLHGNSPGAGMGYGC